MNHESPTPPPQNPEPLRTLCSEDLLQGDREVAILHNGEIYKLRKTKSGKLILNK
ncbi:MAG: hemin uptake protein HemP [Planctomycetaceae bacterium]|nr:hemin uptake protein HemP [Planctomycetaceae bacterium]